MFRLGRTTVHETEQSVGKQVEKYDLPAVDGKVSWTEMFVVCTHAEFSWSDLLLVLPSGTGHTNSYRKVCACITLYLNPNRNPLYFHYSVPPKDLWAFVCTVCAHLFSCSLSGWAAETNRRGQE